MLIYIYIFFFKKYFLVPCEKFGSPYVVKAQQQPQEQRYNPFLSVCAVFPCVQTMVRLPVLGTVDVRTAVDACDCTHGGCADTVRESALEVDLEREIPCRIGDSNPR